MADYYNTDVEEIGTITRDEVPECMDLLLSSAFDEDIISNRETRIQNIIKISGSDNPLDWFSDDEIKNFINENYLPPCNEEEMVLNKLLNEILQKGFGTEYYTFPQKWEENGIAELIRSKYSING